MEGNKEFPVEIFPPEIQRIIYEAQKAYCFPVCYTSGAILTATSAILGNSSKLELMKGLIVKPNLFMALVGEPGAVKSHPVKFALGPLMAKDLITIGKHNEKLHNLSQQEKEAGETPIAKQMIVKDTTIEALASVLNGNPNGVCVYSDELNGWFNSFNCYKGGRGRDTEAWLSLYDGDDLVVNRKGSSEVICVPNPFVSVIGGIQPQILRNRFKGALMDNGFIYRILFVVDHTTPEPLLWNSYSSTCKEDWKQITDRLFEMTKTANTYVLSSEAWELIREWQNATEKQLHFEQDKHQIASFRKLQIVAVKFSVIIHVLWAVLDHRHPGIEITKRSVDLAIKASEYFFTTAFNIRTSILGANEVDENVRKLLALLPQRFTAKEAVAVGETISKCRSTVFNYLKMAQQSLIVVPDGIGGYMKISSN